MKVILLTAESMEQEKQLQAIMARTKEIAQKGIQQIQQQLQSKQTLTLDECAAAAEAIQLYQNIIDGVIPPDEDEDL